MRKMVALSGILISVLGIALLWYFGHWWLALGAFLLVWGNNVGEEARRH